MVHDAEVARNYFVLQHGAGWNVDPVSVVSDDDDGALGGRGGGKLILKSFFLLQHYYRSWRKMIKSQAGQEECKRVSSTTECYFF